MNGRWRRSSFCNGGECVEVRQSGDGTLMRDGKDRSGPVLVFSREEWEAFLAEAKSGEHDLPPRPARA